MRRIAPGCQSAHVRRRLELEDFDRKREILDPRCKYVPEHAARLADAEGLILLLLHERGFLAAI